MAETTRILRNYALPLLAVALACVVTLLVWQLGQPAAFVAFIAAVIVASWQGGLRGGLVATSFSALALVIVNSLQPGPQTAEATQEFFLRLGLFVFMGVAAGYLAMQCQRAVGAHDRLQHTLAGAGEAWIFADLQGRVTFLNPLAQAWTGWSLAHARHRPLEQLFVLLHEDSREPIALSPAQAVVQRAPLTLPADAVLLSAGGSAIPIEGCIRPLQDSDDRIVEIMLTFRDVTTTRCAARELAEREARVDNLAEAAPAGLMVLDHEARCTQANRRAQELCGCTAEEMPGQGWVRHMHQHDRDAVLTGVQSGLTERRAFVSDVRMTGKGNASAWVQLRSAPFPAAPGQRPSAVVVLEDVAALKQTEVTLVEARADARARMAELERSQDEKRLAAEAAQKKAEEHLAEQTHAQNDAVAAHNKALTYLEGRLQEQTQAREALTVEMQSLKAASEKELQELRGKLAERDQGEEKARRELASQMAEERKRRQELEHQLGEMDAAQAAALQAKQAECDRTTEECLSALAELETLRQAATRAGAQGQAALVTAQSGFENRIRELEATHHAALEALQHQLAASRHAEAHVRREQAEVLQRHEQAAASQRQALQELRQELVRVQQAEGLATQRASFHTALLDACPHGLFAYDHQQRITYWNPALTDLTGKPASEMLGQPVQSFFPDLEAAPSRQLLSWGSERVQIGSGSLTPVIPGRRGQIAIVKAPFNLPDQNGSCGLAMVWELPAPASSTPQDRVDSDRNGTLQTRRESTASAASTVDGDWLSYN